MSLANFLKKIPAARRLVFASRDLRKSMQVAGSRRSGKVLSQASAYLASCPRAKLQIGSGRNYLDGWLNTDFEPEDNRYVFMDATQVFPFQSDTFSFVFNEHIIEHISYEGGQNLLAESFRVLKPGGVIRVATPNLANLLQLFEADLTDTQKRYIQWSISEYFPKIDSQLPSFVLNNFMRQWGHLFVYDPPSLQFSLEGAGFTEVHLVSVGESQHPELRGIEKHGSIIGDEFNLLETMVMEGTKPT